MFQSNRHLETCQKTASIINLHLAGSAHLFEYVGDTLRGFLLYKLYSVWDPFKLGDFCVSCSATSVVVNQSLLLNLWISALWSGSMERRLTCCVLPLLTTSTWFCDALPLANCWHGNLWMILSVDCVHRLTQTHSGGWFGDCKCLPQQWNYHTIDSQDIAICTLFHTYWQMKSTFIIQIADMHIENSY